MLLLSNTLGVYFLNPRGALKSLLPCCVIWICCCHRCHPGICFKKCWGGGGVGKEGSVWRRTGLNHQAVICKAARGLSPYGLLKMTQINILYLNQTKINGFSFSAQQPNCHSTERLSDKINTNQHLFVSCPWVTGAGASCTVLQLAWLLHAFHPPSAAPYITLPLVRLSDGSSLSSALRAWSIFCFNLHLLYCNRFWFRRDQCLL